MSLISRDLRSNVLTLPAGTGPQKYKFVTWTPREASLSHWTNALEGLQAILFIADLELHNDHLTYSLSLQDLDSTLERFRLVCEIHSFAQKDIILAFPNIKLLAGHLPISIYGCIIKEQTTLKDIVDGFVSINNNKSREVHVIFTKDGNRAGSLDYFEIAMQLILKKKKTNSGP